MYLREWMCLPPAYWTDAQLSAYLSSCAQSLEIGMNPVIAIASPLAAALILLDIMVKIAHANPAWSPAILNAMATVAEKMSPPVDKGKMN